ncbi:uncharacterized protein DCS_05132 [Drechmeria coniospora]|uniref:Thioredoxin-like fold protein n=1 Tax=Drechmeria coniospora TaxID=98403 RepID=A0A151GLZ2_DRECN|nr:uncharacterized protein DCS_05132 [Drechmeria coniospora]KYK58119.1 uncharacterized protein DCS_05132 [Drechmeria coniospora]ODA83042.1 hypothetical protein RJ55_01551 [Drechmeria coniospora]
MLSSLTTKIALKKIGLPSNALDFSSPAPARDKYQKNPRGGPYEDDDEGAGIGSWFSYKSLPLSVHPWFSPPPAAAEVARAVPRVGDLAPSDRNRQLQVGRGRRVLVVFLRCVGCAFAQKTFLALRTLANRHASSITCIAVSHSSPSATRKWVDLLGGAWNVQVIIDEDRAIYAAWGLGTAGVWHLFNPTTQVQGWKEKGWLGERVAEAIQRRGQTTEPEGHQGASTALGNKWQESGAFAVDGRGTVIWGGRAARADEVMDLDQGARLLCM